MPDMSERDKRDLFEMVELLADLGVLGGPRQTSDALNHVVDLFDKWGHYDNYN